MTNSDIQNPNDGTKAKLLPKGIILPFILLSSCFMWWGIANNLTDPLVKAFKSIFPDLSTFQSSLIQFAFYGGYFCLAIPAALINRKFSYKAGVLIGLGIYALGCFLLYPASQTLTFWTFLVAYLVLASGLSILETSANPYILSLGPAETATRRLNLAQAFNPVGSVIGILLCGYLVMEKLEPWKNLDKATQGELAFIIPTADQPKTLAIVIFPYLAIGTILGIVWLAILLTRMPHMAEPRKLHFGQSFARLAKNPNYIFAVVAQFFYVGAQITVWTYTNFYIPDQLEWVDQSDVLLHWHIWALVSFGLCRFLFTWLMTYFKDYNLLLLAAVLAAILTISVVFIGGLMGSVSLIAVSAFMSLMFPTIFGLGSRELGEDTKVGASGLIMAILGGALITPLQGFVIDISNVSVSYLVPLVCFIVIASYAAYCTKAKVVHEAPKPAKV